MDEPLRFILNTKINSAFYFCRINWSIEYRPVWLDVLTCVTYVISYGRWCFVDLRWVSH